MRVFLLLSHCDLFGSFGLYILSFRLLYVRVLAKSFRELARGVFLFFFFLPFFRRYFQKTRVFLLLCFRCLRCLSYVAK